MKNVSPNRRLLVYGATAAIVLVAAVVVLNFVGRPTFTTVAIVEHPIYTNSTGVVRALESCTRATDCDVVATLRNDGGAASGTAIFSAATFTISREQQPDTHCTTRIPQTPHGASVAASCRLSASAGNYLEDPVSVHVEK